VAGCPHSSVPAVARSGTLEVREDDPAARLRPTGFRGHRDDRAPGLLRLAESTSAAAPKASEPARLKPFLDKAARNFRRTVEGWRGQGLIDAAHHLEHFLDRSGAPITYNRDQARSFSPVRSAEQDAQRQIRARLREEARRLKDGESKTVEFPVTGGWPDWSRARLAARFLWQH
jgi:hypothetical protein